MTERREAGKGYWKMVALIDQLAPLRAAASLQCVKHTVSVKHDEDICLYWDNEQCWGAGKMPEFMPDMFFRSLPAPRWSFHTGLSQRLVVRTRREVEIPCSIRFENILPIFLFPLCPVLAWLTHRFSFRISTYEWSGPTIFIIVTSWSLVEFWLTQRFWEKHFIYLLVSF